MKINSYPARQERIRYVKVLQASFTACLLVAPLVIGAPMIHVPTPVASPTLSMPPLEELLGLGLNALERGDAPAALSHWQSALVVAPHNGAVRNNLGIALMKVYRYSEALEMFRAAVFLEPTAQLYRNNLNWAQRELNAVRQEHQQ